jgi:fructose-specific phosphotransferase system IIA component
MALIELIEKKVIKIPLISRNKSDVLKELVDILVETGKIEDADTVLRDVLKREEMGSTGLEEGIAVPHAKTEAVKTLTVAIGISPAGIDFEALDGKPSQLFFLLLAPPSQVGPHIEALSDIARMTKSKTFIRLLTAAKNAEEVEGLFKED